MVDPATGKYRRTRLFVLTLGYSRKSVRLHGPEVESQVWCRARRAVQAGGWVARVRSSYSTTRRASSRLDIYAPRSIRSDRDVLAQVRNPDEVECRFRRKWNTESGGSGISIPGSGTRNPGSGTSNPEEVEHRFRDRERSSVA